MGLSLGHERWPSHGAHRWLQQESGRSPHSFARHFQLSRDNETGSAERKVLLNSYKLTKNVKREVSLFVLFSASKLYTLEIVNADTLS